MVATNFRDGDILYAANLNLDFNQSVSISGDDMTGPLTISGVDIGTGLASSFIIANSALNLSKSAFNQANAASGGIFGNGSQTIITANGLTVNTGTLLQVFGNNIVVLSANLGNTTQVGVIRLNDTVTSNLANQAATSNSVNTAWATAQAAFVVANSNLNLVASPFNLTNSTTNLVTGAYNLANSDANLVASAYALANSDQNLVASAFTLANSTTNLVASAFGEANAFQSIINSSFALTNSTTNLVASAFAKANTGGGGGVGGNGIIAILTANGITVNTGTLFTITGNNTIVLSANIANTTKPGIVQLNDSVTSILSSQAATANAVNTVWATAQSAFVRANTSIQNQQTFVTIGGGLTVNTGTTLVTTGNNTIVLAANLASVTQPGILQLNDTVLSQLTSQAATANAVNTAWRTAQAAFAMANTNFILASQMIITANGLTVNNNTAMIIFSVGSLGSLNSIIVLSANNSSTGAVGVVQLSDNVGNSQTNYASTSNVSNTIWATAQAAFRLANTAVQDTGDVINGVLTMIGLTANVGINTGFIVANSNITAANLVTTGAVNSAVIMVQPAVGNISLSMANSGKVILINSPNSTTLNVPNNTLQVGFRCIVTQLGTGNVIFHANNNVILNSPSRILTDNIAAQYCSASLFCYSPNTFILTGEMV